LALTISATHSAFSTPHSRTSPGFSALRRQDVFARAQAAASAIALLTWAGRPLLAVAAHCVYCSGQVKNPKNGLFWKQVSR
jgi:hypothetical protein